MNVPGTGNGGRRKSEWADPRCRYCNEPVYYDDFDYIRDARGLMHHCPNAPQDSQQARQMAQQFKPGLVV